MASGDEATSGMRRFASMLVDGDDGRALDALLAAGFTYTHRSGRVETRDEILEAVRGGRRYGRMELDEMTTRRYGSTEVVQGLAHMRGGSGPSLIEFDSRFSAVWVEVDGAPRLAVYHSTSID